MCNYDALLGNQRWTSRADRGAALQIAPGLRACPRLSALAAAERPCMAPQSCLHAVDFHTRESNIGATLATLYISRVCITLYMWALHSHSISHVLDTFRQRLCAYNTS